jgi:hypothetical protein
MRHPLEIVVFASIISSSACTGMTREVEKPLASQVAAQPAAALPAKASDYSPVGRFQLIVAPGHPGSLFLVDTVTGCLWHQMNVDDSKRVRFVEIDVDNLHWSWGSGSQQVLATRIDSSSLNDQQKHLFKEGLQRTACGITPIVLTPSPASTGQGTGGTQSLGAMPPSSTDAPVQ